VPRALGLIGNLPKRGSMRLSSPAVLGWSLAGILSLFLVACMGVEPPHPKVLPTDRALGIELDLLGLSPARRRAAIGRASQLGIRWLRLPLRWATLETRRGQIDWSALDDALAAADSGRLQVLLSVHGAPAWARHDPPPPAAWWLCDEPAARAPFASDLAPPSDPQDLALFLTRLAFRYPERVAAVEVWREPNVLPGWRASGPDPEDYGRLLTAASQALRAAAPGWRIVSAGLAPVRVAASPVCFQSDLVFLDRLAASGALAAVDAIGVQPLGLEEPALDPPAAERLNFRRAELHRAILVRHGLAAKPLWLLATGWRASEDGRPSPWGAWPPEAAAAELRAAWKLARDSWPWAGPFFLRHTDPDPSAAEDGRQGYRLWPSDDAGTALTALGWAASRLTMDSPPMVTTVQVKDGAGRLSPPAPWWPAVPGALTALLGLVVFMTGQPVRTSAAPPNGSRRPYRPRAAGLVGVRTPELAAMLGRRRGIALALVLVLILANAYLPSWIGLVCLAALGLVALLDPTAILTLAVATLPWHDSLRLRLWSRPVLPFEGLLLLVLAAVTLRRLVLGPRIVRAHDLAVSAAKRRDLGLLLLFVGWGAVAAAHARMAEPAWFEWRTVMLEPALFFVLLRYGDDRWPAMRQVLLGLLVGAAAASLMALAGVLLSALSAAGFAVDARLASGVAAEGVLRALGPYGSPNNLALWLGRALPLAFAAALVAGRRWSILAWMVVGLVGLGLMATFSRGSWVLGLPALGLVAALAWQRRDRTDSGAAAGGRGWAGKLLAGRVPAAILALTVALALFLSPMAASERLRGTLSLEPGSTAYIRLRLWQSAVAMVIDHPWTGVGPDNFLYAYRDRYVQRDVVQERSLSHAHNLLLDWATRLGLPGLSIGLLLLGSSVWALRQAARAPRLMQDHRVWLWGLIGMQAYSLAHGLVDNHFFLVDLAAAQWLLLAAARSLAQAGADAPQPSFTDRRT